MVVSKGAGENGDVRRNPEFIKELVATAFPGEVATMFDAFQCVNCVGVDSLLHQNDRPCLALVGVDACNVTRKIAAARATNVDSGNLCPCCALPSALCRRGLKCSRDSPCFVGNARLSLLSQTRDTVW